MIEVGQILNDTYEIVEKIGAGGGGIVFKAYHKRLEKNVAIKLIKENVKEHINQRAETDILKNLKHESLPQVYDFIVDGDDVYTVMEYIDGGSLFDEIVKKGRIPYQQSLEWAKELCSAAAYLHTRKPKIIHSDIKPQNIMITTEKKLCLIDFNISSVFGGGLYTVGSSDGYSPPEQYLARPDRQIKTTETQKREIPDNNKTEIITEKTEFVDDATERVDENVSDGSERSELLPQGVIDTRSDVYSIGAVMYCMITGRKPANSRNEIIPLHRIDENIPEAYVYIVEKAMSKDKKDRFDSAVEMLDALEHINRLDRRYRVMRVRQMAGYLFCLALMTASVISIIAGHRMMAQEKSDKLAGYISQMAQMEESNDFSGFDEIYNAAVSEYPDSPEPHYYKAFALYNSREFSEAADYINNNLYQNIDSLPGDLRSNTYFMLADIYYREENYESAVPMYEEAVGYDPENPDIYRDFAVSLARVGNTDRAGEVLDMAVAHDLTEDGIYYVTAEIDLMQKNFDNAIENAKQAVSLTDNDDLKRNSYFVAVKAYNELIGSGDEKLMTEKIDMLREAVAILPPDMSDGQIKEYLVQAYIDYGQFSGRTEYYAEAVSLLDEMRKNGWTNYQTEMNLAILLDRIGNTKGARDELLEMLQVPEYESYYFKIYVMLAYCEADIQSELDTKERDYSKFDEYYRSAESRYEEYRELHGSDPEMDRLTAARNELAGYGWL